MAEENAAAVEETVQSVAGETKPAADEQAPAAVEEAPAVQLPEDEDEMDIDRLLDEFDGASPEEQEINQLIRAEMLVQAKATRNASPDTFERGDRIKEQAQRRAQREALRKQMREDMAKRKELASSEEAVSDVVVVAK
uniref:Uncharacterized protein n=1 Tax=Chrysotila carterae TaxID=13221 RepID=A0A7S4B1I1_CHRCT|mmetsp:Transcript_26399/g.57846  ORF Transcript_26399/g.57846 Transcript_26399/m.57846 type:complete len:138 (+) Transcript_26399:734-1147(+)